MTPSRTLDEGLVAETARWMLDRAGAAEPAQVAAERRVFEALRTAYVADPARALAGDLGGGRLSFGLPGAEELLTPVLLAASSEVLRYLADRGATLTRAGVRRMLGRPADAAPDVVEPAGTSGPEAPLTAEQWAEVRAIVTRGLIRYGRISPQRADMIAAAIVGDGTTGPGSA